MTSNAPMYLSATRIASSTGFPRYRVDGNALAFEQMFDQRISNLLYAGLTDSANLAVERAAERSFHAQRECVNQIQRPLLASGTGGPYSPIRPSAISCAPPRNSTTTISVG